MAIKRNGSIERRRFISRNDPATPHGPGDLRADAHTLKKAFCGNPPAGWPKVRCEVLFVSHPGA
jgi:hypothetical protein